VFSGLPSLTGPSAKSPGGTESPPVFTPTSSGGRAAGGPGGRAILDPPVGPAALEASRGTRVSKRLGWEVSARDSSSSASRQLVHTLIENDLVDELRLMVFPVALV
jgi:hypothetical protein